MIGKIFLIQHYVNQMNIKKKIAKYQKVFWLILFVTSIGLASIYYINIGLKGRDIKVNSLESKSTEWIKTSDVNNELTTGSSIQGKIISNYPDLGSVLVRFTTFRRGSKDIIIFRIKEEGSDKDYFSAKYNADQIQDNMLFPFGFPEIRNSENKNYIVEISSSNASTGSGLAISKLSPNLMGYHYFSKDWFNEEPVNVLKFIRMKAINLLSDEYMLPAIIFSLIIPIIHVLLFFFFPEDILLVFPILLISFIIDVQFILPIYPVIILSSIVSLSLLIIRLKMDLRVLLLVCLLPISFLVLAIFDSNTIVMEKSIVWLVSIIFFLPIFNSVYKPKTGIEDIDPNNIIIIIRNRYIHTSLQRIIKHILFFVAITLLVKVVDKVIDARVPFSDFFPDEYPMNFIISVLTPVSLIVTIFSSIYYRYIFRNDKTKLYLLVLTLLLSAITSSVIRKQTDFYSSAHIVNISPDSTSEPWVDVVVTGFNFEDLPFIGKVEINGVEQRIIFWSNNKVVFRTNPGSTKSGIIIISTHRGSITNLRNFEYDLK